MKHKFFNTIRKKMIFMQVALLVVVMAIISGVFILFSNSYYYSSKLKAMERGFGELKDTDISRINAANSTILRMEEQRFKVLISDENFNCIYYSDTNLDPIKKQAKVYNKIVSKEQKYSTVFTKKNLKYRISGYGYI